MSSQEIKSKWNRLKEILSLLGSIYSVFLLIGLLISIIVQILPILENPISVEIGKYSTIVFVSILVSYIALKHTERGISEKIVEENAELRGYLTAMNRVFVYDTRIAGCFLQVFFASLQPKGKLETFDYVMQQIKNKEERLEEMKSLTKKYPELLTLTRHGNINVIIEVCSKWKIPFREVAHYLCDKLGKNIAKRLVETETILKAYGKEEVSMWKSITTE